MLALFTLDGSGVVVIPERFPAMTELTVYRKHPFVSGDDPVRG